MNDTIEKLEKQKERYEKLAEDVQSKIQTEFNAKFNKDKYIQELIKTIQNSDQYWTNEMGDICHGIYNIDLEKYSNNYYELGEYLSDEHFINLDFNPGSTLYENLGSEEIIIQRDGIVFIGSKLMLNDFDYNSEQERNQLIEEYMEKSGYFPGVFLDCNGHLTLIDTKKVG